MTTTLNASTAGAGGFIATSDNSGILALQTAGTTALTIDASQNITTANKFAKASLPTGSVLQVVQIVKTDSFTSATSGFVDITGLSVSITPTSATSKILIFATITAGSGTGDNLGFNLVRNSTNINQSTSGTANRTLTQNYGTAFQSITSPITFLDSPSTTSATTYKLQMDSGGLTTCKINVRSTDSYYGGVSQITLMEIAV